MEISNLMIYKILILNFFGVTSNAIKLLSNEQGSITCRDKINNEKIRKKVCYISNFKADFI